MIEQRVYQVRENRPLHYLDPRDPNAGRGFTSELWARPGEYIDAWHPVLRDIAQAQRHKLRPLKPGDVIPAGSVLVVDVTSAVVRARIRAFDGSADTTQPTIPADVVVQADGSVAPGRKQHTHR